MEQQECDMKKDYEKYAQDIRGRYRRLDDLTASFPRKSMTREQWQKYREQRLLK